MAGTRDSEIAAGIHQPAHRCGGSARTPHGLVHHFRMSLWAEHLAAVEPCFRDASSLQCVVRVNELAEVRGRAEVERDAVARHSRTRCPCGCLCSSTPRSLHRNP